MLTPSVSLAYYRVMGCAKYLQRTRTVKFTLFYWKHTKQYNMRRNLLLSIVIALCMPLFGNQVDETTAKQLAQNFWKENNIMGVRDGKVFKKRMNDARFVNVAPQCGYTEFYIFNNEDGKGFVIIAADDCVTPILGYSYENNFAAENLPSNLKGWLDGYAEQIRAAIEMRAESTEEIRTKWECLRQCLNLPVKSETAVNPLVTTTWSQAHYYNMFCPEDNSGPDGHALTGCVATAMAQILQFWEYPNDAHRVVWHEYEHPVYGTLGANFSYAGGSYYWSIMPNQLTSSSSTNQKQAVASLMYHCGVSVEMNYGPDESLAYPTAAEIAFRAFFDYNNATLESKSTYTDTQWINLLKNELNNGRPVFYGGSGTGGGGHAFVCDGYNNSNYFHFNWGFNGQSDGFYPLNSLTPYVNGYQFDFSYNQEAIIGIEPGGSNNYHLLSLNDDIRINGDNLMYYYDNQIQEITTEIFNWGNEAFNGSLCAAIYDGEGFYIAESNFLNNCQIQPMQSTGLLSFTFSEPLNILTCKALVCIFLIENNQFVLVSAYGMHSNPSVFYNYYTQSEEPVELYLYSDIDYSPSSIYQNSAIIVTADIINNDGNITFVGDYAAELYGLDGELKQILALLYEGNGLQPGYHYTSPLTFSCPSVNVPPGTYYLTITQKLDGSDSWFPLFSWPTCDNPEHMNPIRVEVLGPVSYTITATPNPSNGGTISGQGEYLEGETCTLIASAYNGYTFVNWTENGAQVSNNANYTFTVTENRNLVANFQAMPQQYAISVSANPSSGGSVSGGGTYNQGQSCTVHAVANSGFTFVNWTENGTQVSTNANYTFTVTGNRNLVANFEAQLPEYTVGVSANPSIGGNVSGGGTYTQGQSCTVSASANDGYTFVNWTENGTQVSTNTNYTFQVTGNRTLVANFQIQSYTISVAANPSNGGTVTGGGTFEYGQTCSVTANAGNGYNFINWTENGIQISTNASYSFTVTGNRNLVANFTSQSYVITAIADPTSGGVVTGSGGYNYGETCTLTATANTGYTFVNWTRNGTQVSTNSTYSFTVTESATYVAHFNIQSYSITVAANPNNAGSVTGGGSYNYGQTCTVHATANSGYTFTNWTENGTQVSTNANYSFTVTSNRNLVANFAQNTHTIQASAGANGIITPSGTVAVAHGSNQSFSMIPDTDYVVQEVYIDGSPVGAMTSYTFTNVTSDHYIHVTFMHVESIGENNDNGIKAYPNPTNGIVTIEGEGLSHIRIVNVFGQVIFDTNVDDEQISIDLSQIGKGIYIMHINAAGGQTVKKVVVE